MSSQRLRSRVIYNIMCLGCGLRITFLSIEGSKVAKNLLGIILSLVFQDKRRNGYAFRVKLFINKHIEAYFSIFQKMLTLLDNKMYKMLHECKMFIFFAFFYLLTHATSLYCHLLSAIFGMTWVEQTSRLWSLDYVIMT